VVGLSAQQARAALQAAGFTGNVNTDSADSTKPRNTVVAVSPPQGSPAGPTTTITLSVSDGDAPIPSVAGKTRQDAEQTLRAAGFSTLTVQDVESGTVPEGRAVGTAPGVGSQASAATSITLLIAVPVPPAATATAAPTTSSAPPAAPTSTATRTPAPPATPSSTATKSP
jgi:serine/threonine-protein kinase